MSAKIAKLNCAGQECHEREGCRRFEVRVPDHTLKLGDKEMPIYEWASFDIERQRAGTCPHRIQWSDQRRRAA